MDNFFCPYCHRKNDSNFTRCKYCGELLVPDKNPTIDTTTKVGKAASLSETPDCDQVENWLGDDALALFPYGSEKRFVFTGSDPIVLGRGGEEPGQNVCDLSVMGLQATGISRRHAVIRKTAVGYSLQDLNSTNGTWLNESRLVPGETVRLNIQDLITLAQLRLTVCFHTNKKVERTEMRLHKRNQLALETRKLYPNFMSVFLVPYLEAIAELQRLVGQSRSQPLSEPRIHKIVEDQTSVLVSLDLDAAVQQIISYTLQPWREAHTEYIGWTETANDAAMSEQLHVLTKEIITSLVPFESLMSSTVKNVETAVATIITSPLEPTFSS